MYIRHTQNTHCLDYTDQMIRVQFFYRKMIILQSMDRSKKL